MEKIGTCPVCGKGSMIEGTRGWSCNHFKAVDDQCRFTIFNEYFKKTITREMALQLITTGETGIFNDLESREGKVFSASLTIDKQNSVVKAKFTDRDIETLENHCPACHGSVKILSKGYVCENFFRDEDKCQLWINREIAGTQITEEVAEILLSGEKTEIMEFTNKEQEPFHAKLYLDENLKTKWDYSICKCPKCGEGEIKSNKKSYGCSNWNNENNKCDFSIWKEMSGKEITPEIVTELCENKETSILEGFKTKGEDEYEGKLILSDDMQVKLI